MKEWSHIVPGLGCRNPFGIDGNFLGLLLEVLK